MYLIRDRKWLKARWIVSELATTSICVPALNDTFQRLTLCHCWIEHARPVGSISVDYLSLNFMTASGRATPGRSNFSSNHNWLKRNTGLPFAIAPTWPKASPCGPPAALFPLIEPSHEQLILPNNTLLLLLRFADMLQTVFIRCQLIILIFKTVVPPRRSVWISQILKKQGCAFMPRWIDNSGEWGREERWN